MRAIIARTNPTVMPTHSGQLVGDWEIDFGLLVNRGLNRFLIE